MRTQLVPFLFFLSFSYGYAQIEVPSTLQDAIHKAIEKNTSLKNKDLDIEKLNLQEKGVWNKYIPTIEASTLYSYFDNTLTVDLPTATIPIVNYPLFDGKTAFKNYGNIFNASLMAKTVLFSGMQIPNRAKAIQEKSKGTLLLKESEKDEIIKDVINTFDQLELLKEMDGLLKESEIRLQTETKWVTKAIEQGLAIPYDRGKIKLASLELDSKRKTL